VRFVGVLKIWLLHENAWKGKLPDNPLKGAVTVEEGSTVWT
jgi:hypothetical protein